MKWNVTAMGINALLVTVLLLKVAWMDDSGTGSPNHLAPSVLTTAVLPVSPARAAVTRRTPRNAYPFPLFLPSGLGIVHDNMTQTDVRRIAETVQRRGVRVPTAPGSAWNATLLAEHDGTCRYFLVLQRPVLDADGDTKQLSNSTVWDTFIRHHVGPDALRVTILSDQELSMGAACSIPPEHSAAHGLMTYLVVARGRTRGDYVLQVRLEHDKYWALNEMHDSIPYSLKQDLLQHRVRCDASVATVDRGATSPHLARCKGLGRPHEGCTYGRDDRPRGGRIVRGAEYQLECANCSVERYHRGTAARVWSCLSRRVLFIGDSHIRTLFWHWAAVVDDTVPRHEKVFNITIAHREKRTIATSTFLWDGYLERWLAYRDWIATNADVVVFGCGSWPASYGQWTVERWRHHHAEITASALQQLVDSGVTVVYAGAPAWPKFRKNNPGFRISNYRLGLFEYIVRHYLPQQARILPFFELSYPLPRLRAKDGMHYDDSIILYSAADLLATYIC